MSPPADVPDSWDQFIAWWPKSVDLAAWRTCLDGFAAAHERGRTRRQSDVPDLDIFEILNVEARELQHSYLLRWLLDGRETHEQGGAFFGALLDQLELPREWASGERSWESERERESIDLLLHSHGRFAIAIENKVRHYERERQLDDYWERLQRLADGWRVPEANRIMVFLTPGGRPPSTLSAERSARQLSYADLARILERAAWSDAVRSPVIERIVESYARTARTVSTNYSWKKETDDAVTD